MFLPGYWGAALSGLDAASRGDDAGVLAAAAGAAVGASGVGDSLSSTLQSSANLSPTVANGGKKLQCFDWFLSVRPSSFPIPESLQ